jgi:hypothetical protein
MKKILKIFALSAIVLACFSSCYDGILITGNKEVTEEIRPLPYFNKIYSEGSFKIFYSHGDSTKVTIVCESNLLPYLETAVFNNKLDIRFATHVNVSIHNDIELYITSPAIERIYLAGSGNIIADSITGNDMKIELSGSGNIYSTFYGGTLESTLAGSGKMELFGDCDTLEAIVSGSGKIDLETPDCRYTYVSILGSGNAELIGKSVAATYKIIGSGNIKAFEFPVEEAEVNLSGSGNAYVNVSESLDAVLSGSGNLLYIGNPEIYYRLLGSGKLINDN